MNDTSPNVHTDEIVQRQVQLLERVVHACLAEASRFTVNPDSLAQEIAVALHGTIVELAHACGALVLSDDFSSIPIVMRSLLEASIDQANLLVDADYVMNMEAADHTKFLDLLQQSVPGTNPYLAGLAEQHDISAEIREKEQRISELAANGRRNLSIFDRFKRANAEDQYRSVYALLCLDSHNNFSELAERHMDELPDGRHMLSFFKLPPVATLRTRLDSVIATTLNSALSIHAAFKTGCTAFEPLHAEHAALRAAVISARARS